MKKTFLVLVFGFIFALAAYAVPQYIDYQGMLRNSSGSALTGTYSMTFKIYNASSGGSSVFDSGAQSVSVSNGIYNVRLGPVTSSIFDGNDKWLEVVVGSETMSPRLRINSVAYSIRADIADYAAVSGTATNAATATTVSDRAITGTKLATDINISTTGVVTTGAFTLNSGKLNITTGTNVAVGTGEISDGTVTKKIYNNMVTSNSIILLTVGHATSVAGTNLSGGIRISVVSQGDSFTVARMNELETTGAIPFSYLIIN